ncbi:NmrA family NAD(P)-binding protein [Sphingobium sp.]|uniref:NmrA family NAD(P)-binding protein n=1 Tax=Sphingobium sp. TaxID=1912891 RepID=UPI0028BE089D|nr:NmrA family NAD(P)-binding protein [Sphingobium sp.]
MTEFTKKIPASIGIFGATGHIGTPMARWLRYNAPGTRLRLMTSNPGSVAGLQQAFPDCEVAIGDFYDLPGLTKAVDGLEGLFVVPPNGTREEVAMTNLVDALKRSGSLVHMIRTLGIFPHMNPRRIPAELVQMGMGLEVQHPIARRILEDSDLPVTFFNLGASFLDNFLRPRFEMLSPGKVTWPDRRVPMIDPREIGEAAARILLSDNARHIHQFQTLNNGSDYITMGEMVRIMSEELLIDIEHDSSKEGLFALLEPAVRAGKVREGMPEYLWNFFRYEDANDVAWVLNDFLERTLGRKPNTVRGWIREHREQLRAKLRPA